MGPPRLSDRDYRAALDFVGEAHDAQDRDEFRAVLLPGYRRLVGCEWASYNELAGTTPLAAIVEPDLPGWAADAWARHAGENPLLQKFLRTRDGRAFRFSDVTTPAQLRQMPIFTHLYQPLGIDRQIAFVLPSTPELTIAVALCRSGRDFNERDRTLLELTRPHLIQAYRAAEVRERLVATIAGLRSGLDTEGGAMVVLGDDDTVLFASIRARELSERLLGAILEEGRPLPPGLDGGRGNASLLVRRIRAGQDVVLLLGEARRELSVDRLRQLGLTPREAEVLGALAEGGETDTVAGDLGISARTVAKHVQQINAKLGVRNRAQAIATAWAAL